MAAESLILFARPPIAGRVKTRLARALGAEGAARLYRHFLQDAAETARAVRDARPGVALVCEWALASGTLPEDLPLADWLPGAFLHRAQTGRDIGQRMAAALGRALASGGRAVLIGTDFPDLPREVLLDAFKKLEAARTPCVVLGPAADGGYYLIGLNRFSPEVFTDLPWSTSEVCALTTTRAQSLGFETTTLREWRDVDEAEDLAALQERLAHGLGAPHTRAFLEGAAGCAERPGMKVSP